MGLTLLLLRVFIVAFSFSLFFTSSIIAFGTLALLLAIAISLLLVFISPWLGIITLLVYVGGLMVMFAYFLAICPNQRDVKFLKSPFIILVLLPYVPLVYKSRHA